MISTLRDGHKLAVAMIDPGDSHTAGMIRLLTGSKTAAGRGSVVIAQKPTRQSRVNPCYLFSRCFHLVDSSYQKHYQEVHKPFCLNCVIKSISAFKKRVVISSKAAPSKSWSKVKRK